MLKLLNNILKNPREEKFRMIKKTNAAIQSKLLSVKGVPELLEALGFISIDEEFYSFIGDYFVVLSKGCHFLEDSIIIVKMKYMSEEDRKKQILLEKQKQIYRDEMKKK